MRKKNHNLSRLQTKLSRIMELVCYRTVVSMSGGPWHTVSEFFRPNHLSVSDILIYRQHDWRPKYYSIVFPSCLRHQLCCNLRKYSVFPCCILTLYILVWCLKYFWYYLVSLNQITFIVCILWRNNGNVFWWIESSKNQSIIGFSRGVCCK